MAMKLTALLVVLSTLTVANAQMARCVEECDKTECAGDVNPRTGCNQMYSCAHACKIRDLGVAGNHCREMCQRNGQSGCSPTVRGWQFNLCRACNRAGCSTYPSIGECVRGCDIYTDIVNPISSSVVVYGYEESFSRCVEECDKTECAGDVNPRIGCNQMYS